MKQGSTLLLKAAVIMMGVPVAALAVFLLLQVGTIAFSEAVDGSVLGYIIIGILILMYISIIPYYASLVQAYKLLTYIDHSQAFSDLSVVALKKIKRFAFVISAIYALMLPLVYVVAEWDDAPGLIVIGMLPIFAALVIGIFAAVLQRLLKEAIEMKLENELTV